MKKFNKGDKVVVIYSDEKLIPPGMKGVVVDHESYQYYVVVNFGDGFEGWSTYTYGVKTKTCWGVPPEHLDFSKEHYLSQFNEQILLLDRGKGK